MASRVHRVTHLSQRFSTWDARKNKMVTVEILIKSENKNDDKSIEGLGEGLGDGVRRWGGHAKYWCDISRDTRMKKTGWEKLVYPIVNVLICSSSSEFIDDAIGHIQRWVVTTSARHSRIASDGVDYFLVSLVLVRGVRLPIGFFGRAGSGRGPAPTVDPGRRTTRIL